MRRSTMDRYHDSILRVIGATLAVFLLLGVSLLICISMQTKEAQAASRPTTTAYESIYVEQGDTLWSIAESYSGYEKTAEFVETVKELNGLKKDTIHVGSYIIVPVEQVL